MSSIQKKITVLALAGLCSGTAFAQSNVKIFGVVDAGFVNSSGDRANGGNANYGGIDSGIMSGSRLGFRGEEGLGNGLKAVFHLEYALAADTNAPLGTGAAATRQSYVGLSHNRYGTIALGRQYAPGYDPSGRNNPFGGSTFISPLSLATAAGNAITANGAARISNSVSYTSPTLAGFTLNAIYGYGEDTTGSNGISAGNNGQFGAGLNYRNGPLNLDAVIHRHHGVTATPFPATVGAVAREDNIDEWAMLGSYDLKVVKLFGSYQALEDKNGTQATNADNSIWSVGAAVPVFGKGTIQLAYARLNWDRSGAGSSDNWALGYRHALSKRTSLYTSYGVADNDRNALAAIGSLAKTRAIGETSRTFTAGINHTF